MRRLLDQWHKKAFCETSWIHIGTQHLVMDTAARLGFSSFWKHSLIYQNNSGVAQCPARYLTLKWSDAIAPELVLFVNIVSLTAHCWLHCTTYVHCRLHTAQCLWHTACCVLHTAHCKQPEFSVNIVSSFRTAAHCQDQFWTQARVNIVTIPPSLRKSFFQRFSPFRFLS